MVTTTFASLGRRPLCGITRGRERQRTRVSSGRRQVAKLVIRCFRRSLHKRKKRFIMDCQVALESPLLGRQDGLAHGGLTMTRDFRRSPDSIALQARKKVRSKPMLTSGVQQLPLNRMHRVFLSRRTSRECDAQIMALKKLERKSIHLYIHLGTLLYELPMELVVLVHGYYFAL